MAHGHSDTSRHTIVEQSAVMMVCTLSVLFIEHSDDGLRSSYRVFQFHLECDNTTTIDSKMYIHFFGLEANRKSGTSSQKIRFVSEMSDFFGFRCRIHIVGLPGIFVGNRISEFNEKC